MALLERVAGLMDSVQITQQRMEERQLELENTVKSIQADVGKLTSDHAATSTTVDRLLEKTRKVSRHIKDVRVRVENQNIRVKKVEATQGDLLAKNKFRVVIYQVGRSVCGSGLDTSGVISPTEGFIYLNSQSFTFPSCPSWCLIALSGLRSLMCPVHFHHRSKTCL